MHKNIKLFYWSSFLVDFNFISVVAVLYFSKISGSYALGMSIFSIIMLSQAFLELPTGIYSDKIGRIKTIRFEAIFRASAFLFYLIAPNYLVLVIGAIMEGTARAFGSGNNEALLYDSLADTDSMQEYEQYLGRISSMEQFAAAFVAIVGSVIAQFNWTLVLILSFIPQLIRVFISLKFIQPKTYTRNETNIYVHTKEAFQLFIKNPKLRYISLASILGFAFGESGYQFRAAFVATLWPTWAIGISRMLSSIGAAVSFWWSGKILNKIGNIKLLFLEKSFSSIINFIAYLFPTIGSPVLLSTTSLFYGVSTVAKSGLMQKEFSQSQRATMGSLNSLGGSLVFAIYSFVLGLFADNIGPAKALVFTQILALSLFYFYIKTLLHDKQKASHY